MRKLAYIIVLTITLSGCGSKNDGGGSPAPSVPEKAVLLFPSQNSVCVTGTIISPTQSTIGLSWNAGANAESYEVNIKNLLTNVVTTQTVTVPRLDIILLRGTPFSWYVVSKSSKTSVTAQTDVWKFYNAGVGITYYAPFPADLTSPGYSVSITAVAGKIDLAWTGSDADNDIAGYDVYLGASSSTLTLLKAAVTDMFLKQVTVTAGTTYYWQVVTKDAQGNSSQSSIYQFTVK